MTPDINTLKQKALDAQQLLNQLQPMLDQFNKVQDTVENSSIGSDIKGVFPESLKTIEAKSVIPLDRPKEHLPDVDKFVKALNYISDEVFESDKGMIVFNINNKRFKWWRLGSLMNQATDAQDNLDDDVTSIVLKLVENLG